jgi:hypothetical protein
LPGRCEGRSVVRLEEKVSILFKGQKQAAAKIEVDERD